MNIFSERCEIAMLRREVGQDNMRHAQRFGDAFSRIRSGLQVIDNGDHALISPGFRQSHHILCGHGLRSAVNARNAKSHPFQRLFLQGRGHDRLAGESRLSPMRRIRDFACALTSRIACFLRLIISSRSAGKYKESSVGQTVQAEDGRNRAPSSCAHRYQQAGAAPRPDSALSKNGIPAKEMIRSAFCIFSISDSLTS